MRQLALFLGPILKPFGLVVWYVHPPLVERAVHGTKPFLRFKRHRA